MDNKKELKVVGKVVDIKRGFFTVELEGVGKTILAYPAGPMKRSFVRISVGDKVEVELSPYDPTRGRIVRRID